VCVSVWKRVRVRANLRLHSATSHACVCVRECVGVCVSVCECVGVCEFVQT